MPDPDYWKGHLHHILMIHANYNDFGKHPFFQKIEYCSNNSDCIYENSICDNNICVCKTGFYLFNSTTCVKKKLYGVRCNASLECITETCLNNVCDCHEGWYFENVCKKKKSYGESCSDNKQCLNNNCHGQKCQCRDDQIRENETCKTGAKLGQNCINHIHCRMTNNRTHCHPIKKVCVCEEESYKSVDVCIKKKYPNADCINEEECLHKICNGGKCQCPESSLLKNDARTCVYTRIEECLIYNTNGCDGTKIAADGSVDTCSTPIKEKFLWAALRLGEHYISSYLIDKIEAHIEFPGATDNDLENLKSIEARIGFYYNPIFNMNQIPAEYFMLNIVCTLSRINKTVTEKAIKLNVTFICDPAYMGKYVIVLVKSKPKMYFAMCEIIASGTPMNNVLMDPKYSTTAMINYNSLHSDFINNNKIEKYLEIPTFTNYYGVPSYLKIVIESISSNINSVFNITDIVIHIPSYSDDVMEMYDYRFRIYVNLINDFTLFTFKCFEYSDFVTSEIGMFHLRNLKKCPEFKNGKLTLNVDKDNLVDKTKRFWKIHQIIVLLGSTEKVDINSQFISVKVSINFEMGGLSLNQLCGYFNTPHNSALYFTCWGYYTTQIEINFESWFQNKTLKTFSICQIIVLGEENGFEVYIHPKSDVLYVDHNSNDILDITSPLITPTQVFSNKNLELFCVINPNISGMNISHIKKWFFLNGKHLTEKTLSKLKNMIFQGNSMNLSCIEKYDPDVYQIKWIETKTKNVIAIGNEITVNKKDNQRIYTCLIIKAKVVDYQLHQNDCLASTHTIKISIESDYVEIFPKARNGMILLKGGTNLLLYCVCKSSGNYVFSSWIKGTTKVSPLNKFWISNVTSADSGIYYCYYENINRETLKSEITLYIYGSSLSKISSSKEYSINRTIIDILARSDGSKVEESKLWKMKCFINLLPDGRITYKSIKWYRNGIFLHESKNTEYVLKSVECTHSGYYMCKIWAELEVKTSVNSIEASSKNVFLQVTNCGYDQIEIKIPIALSVMFISMILTVLVHVVVYKLWNHKKNNVVPSENNIEIVEKILTQDMEEIYPYHDLPEEKGPQNDMKAD
ncbi:unnamed protein product [Gordionus sp. m RMFG-2023]